MAKFTFEVTDAFLKRVYQAATIKVAHNQEREDALVKAIAAQAQRSFEQWVDIEVQNQVNHVYSEAFQELFEEKLEPIIHRKARVAARRTINKILKQIDE